MLFRVKINSVLADDNQEKFFGNGPAYLLKGVREMGSLSAAAKEMGMSYSKAYKIIKRSEEALGFKLITSSTGGKNGGSSVLSKKGEMFLSLYEEYSRSNKLHAENNLDKLMIPENLDNVRFIILASGKGVRFDGNKLLHEIKGKKMIEYLLDTLEPIKEHCIISTIHDEVREIGENRGFVVAYHKEEKLSDSIKSALAMIDEPCATVFMQADQILVTLYSLLALAKAHENKKEAVLKLAYDGKKASPTLFPAKYFEDLSKLEGEQGGSAVIRNDSGAMVEAVEALFPWEIWDIDTREDLKYIEDMILFRRKENR